MRLVLIQSMIVQRDSIPLMVLRKKPVMVLTTIETGQLMRDSVTQTQMVRVIALMGCVPFYGIQERNN